MKDDMINQPSQCRHYLSSLDAHTQESYLMFLAAIAFEDNVLSDGESRYLQGLAKAISDINIDSLIVQLHTIDKEWIDKFIQNLKLKQLGLLFFVDVALMLMSVSRIGESESILLSNLANALQLSDSMARFGVNVAIALIKNEQSLFRTSFDTIDPDYDLDAVCLSYLEARMDDKLGFEHDVANTNKLSGNYIVYKPIHINHELTLKDCRLQFAKYGRIIIESQGKLVLENCQITEGELICESEASLIIDQLDFLGGKGISVCKAATLKIKHSKFYGTGIVASHAKELLITNTEFHGSFAKPCLDIKGCLDVELNRCTFVNPPERLSNKLAVTGAIKAQDSSIYIRNSSFTNCRSSEDGGAINLNSCLFGIDNCEFSHCHSDKNGGAIAISGKSYTDTDSIDAKGTGLRSFLNSVEPITLSPEELKTGGFFSALASLIKLEYSMGSEPQPLISKSRFIECSSAIAGGAILDKTDSLRIINSDFKNNDAKMKPGDLAIVGMFHITCHGTHLFSWGESNISDKTLINDSPNNDSGVKIINCNFKSDSTILQPGLFLNRVYSMLFMSGCAFKNRIISVEYDDVKHEKQGIFSSNKEWSEILTELERDFSNDIRRYNKFVQSGTSSPRNAGHDEQDKLDALFSEPSRDSKSANFISFNRQHLPSAFK